MAIELAGAAPTISADISHRGVVVASTLCDDPDRQLTLGAGSLESVATSPSESGWTADVTVHIPNALVPTHEADILHPMNGAHVELYASDTNRFDRHPIGTLIVADGQLSGIAPLNFYELSFEGQNVLLEYFAPLEDVTLGIGQPNLAAALIAGLVDEKFAWSSPLANEVTGSASYGSPLIIRRPRALAFQPLIGSITELLDPLGWIPHFDRFGQFRVFTPDGIYPATFTVDAESMRSGLRSLTAGSTIGAHVVATPEDDDGPVASQEAFGFLSSDAQVAPMHRDLSDPRTTFTGSGTIEPLSVDGAADRAAEAAADLYTQALLHPDIVTFETASPTVFDIGEMGWVNNRDLTAQAVYRVTGVVWEWEDAGESPRSIITCQKAPV